MKVDQAIERHLENKGLKNFERIANMKNMKLIENKKSLWVATKKTLLENETETILLFIEIARTGYGLIKGICQENQENELECFRFFNIFKKHVNISLF